MLPCSTGVIGVELDPNLITNSLTPLIAKLSPDAFEDVANAIMRTSSSTLVVIKPTITRLPMSNTVTPQYLLGPVRGERVVL